MNGFLDTEGRFYRCEAWEHLDYAASLVESMSVSIYNRLEAEDYLQKIGWIVVRTNDVYGLTGRYKDTYNAVRYHLTDRQKDWLNAAYEDMTPSCRKTVDELFRWDK